MPETGLDAGLVQSYADFAGLARLRGQAHANGVEATRTTAQQFEAMFIQMMLKSMREASFRSDLLGSQTIDTYESMQDQEMSVQLAKRGALGIASMLQRQLAPLKPDPAVKAPVSPDVKSGFPLQPPPPAAMVLQPAARGGIPLADKPGETTNTRLPAFGVLNRD